jgi:hypothetical protein
VGHALAASSPPGQHVGSWILVRDGFSMPKVR